MIWDWAKANRYTIATTDADFVAMSRVKGWPPKVIHLVECDFPLRIIEDLLRQNAIRISEFEKDAEKGSWPCIWTPKLVYVKGDHRMID